MPLPCTDIQVESATLEHDYNIENPLSLQEQDGFDHSPQCHWFSLTWNLVGNVNSKALATPTGCEDPVRTSRKAQRFWGLLTFKGHLSPLPDSLFLNMDWSAESPRQSMSEAPGPCHSDCLVRNTVGNSRWAGPDKGVCHNLKLHNAQLALKTLTEIGTCPFLSPLLLKIPEGEWKELFLPQMMDPFWARAITRWQTYVRLGTRQQLCP